MWYETCAFIREASGDNTIIIRSYDIGSKIYAKLLILREALLGLKEINITFIISEIFT